MTKAREMSEVLVGISAIENSDINTGISIKRSASQTSNILELVDSNSNVLNSFDSNGNLEHLHLLTDYGETSQDLGDISGDIVIDLSKGNTIIMNVIGEVTSLLFYNPTGHQATNFRILLKTLGFDIDWINISDWSGFVPDQFSIGTHGIVGTLIDGDYILEYLGKDLSPLEGVEELPFEITIQTVDLYEEFALPLIESGEYSFKCDWGDGEFSTIYGYDDSSRIHIYPFPGTYTISIEGKMTRWSFNNSGISRLKVISIDAWGNTGLYSLEGGFHGCSNMTSVFDGDELTGTTGEVSNFKNCFKDCSSLISFPLIDTGKAVTLSGAWFGCSGLTSFPLIETSIVNDMSYSWAACSGLLSFPAINTISVVDFSYAWYRCTGLESFPLIYTKYANNLEKAWYECVSLESFPLNAFDKTEGTNFEDSFTGCSLDIESVDGILFSVDFADKTEGVLRLGLDEGFNSPPSIAGLDSKLSLELKGWVVEVNLLPAVYTCIDFSQATLIPLSV
jgi:hypothetical protein